MFQGSQFFFLIPIFFLKFGSSELVFVDISGPFEDTYSNIIHTEHVTLIFHAFNRSFVVEMVRNRALFRNGYKVRHIFSRLPVS